MTAEERKAATEPARAARRKKGSTPRECNYAHMGGCSEKFTHRVDYWIGPARKMRGPWAYFCEHHAPMASHLRLEAATEPARAARRKKKDGK